MFKKYLSHPNDMFCNWSSLFDEHLRSFSAAMFFLEDML